MTDPRSATLLDPPRDSASPPDRGATPDHPAADTRPPLRLLASDDGLVCVDDACLPPEART